MGVPILDRRFLVVSGKGGTGRTTVAAALAVAAMARGKRVLVAQMNAHERLATLLGFHGDAGRTVRMVRPGLSVVNMHPREALLEYVLMTLRSETIARAILDSRAVRGFLGAVPGVESYSMLGKAWFHTTEQESARDKYDMVIVDAPASGHVTTLLRVPRAILEVMPRGPLARDAQLISELLSDERRAAFLAVTLPEELPVRETLGLVRIVRDELRVPRGPIIVNAVPPARLVDPALRAVLDRTREPHDDPHIAPTLSGTRALARRRLDAEAAIARLRDEADARLCELPRYPVTRLRPEHVEELARALEAGLG